MPGHISHKLETSQARSEISDIFARRLAEERSRRFSKQGDFARVLGIKQNRQSRLENGETELRAEYLAACAAEGLDVHYILTGARLVESTALDAETSSMISDILALPTRLRRIVHGLARELLAADVPLPGEGGWENVESPSERRLNSPRRRYAAK